MRWRDHARGARRGAVLVIVATGVTAVALRFWRLGWGLPETLGFPDERLCFSPYAAAFVPLTWKSFDTHSLVYPTFYGYLVGLATTLGHALGWIAEPLRTYSPKALPVARGVSATIGVATVALAGVLAARMYGRAVGLAAAALLAVAPLHAVLAHIASTDVTLTACVVLVMLASFEAASRQSAPLMALAGASAGLSFATKYPGLAMVVPVAWAVLERSFTARSLRLGGKLGAAALAGFALTFAIACPPCLLRSHQMLAEIEKHRFRSSAMYSSAENNWLAPTLGWYGKPYLYELVATFPYSLGWPLYVLSILGLVLALARRERADRIILATALPYFAIMGASQITYPRYFLPLLPALVVLAARALLALPLRNRTRAVALACVWGYSLALSASHVARLSFDQQSQVARWIAQNVEPPGRPDAKVRVAAPHIMLDYFGLARPLQEAGLDHVQIKRGRWFDEAFDVLVLPHWSETAIDRDQPGSPSARDLARLRSGEAGYRPAQSWSSSYVQRDLDAWIDPGLVSDLWVGEIGFTVYVRDGPSSSATIDLPPAPPPR